MASSIPHINLLILPGKPCDVFVKAFEDAIQKYDLKNTISYTIHRAQMAELPRNVKSDMVVSPANSYAILDGGFDDAISRAFSHKDHYFALTRHCQSVLYEKYRGFQPPGSALIIDIPAELCAEGVSNNVWGTKFIGHCPTMRVPGSCKWNREVVYECVWCLLCEIDKHNEAAADEEKIRSMLMTPMGTGAGFLSPEKWASQAVLAMKHYIDAVERPEEWKSMHWRQAGLWAREVQGTHSL